MKKKYMIQKCGQDSHKFNSCQQARIARILLTRSVHHIPEKSKNLGINCTESSDRKYSKIPSHISVVFSEKKFLLK